MVELIQLFNALKFLATGGVILRTIYCLTKMAMNSDDRAMYIKRMKNMFMFYIFSISTLSLLSLIEKYVS